MFFIVLCFVLESSMQKTSRSVCSHRRTTHSILASASEGFVLPPIHLVCGNISADSSYFFISEKPLQQHCFSFCLVMIPFIFWSSLQLVLGESVAVTQCMLTQAVLFGWSGGEWRGVPQLFLTPAMPGLQKSHDLAQFKWFTSCECLFKIICSSGDSSWQKRVREHLHRQVHRQFRKTSATVGKRGGKDQVWRTGNLLIPSSCL